MRKPTAASRGPQTVYLLHFDRPYRHARHYLGVTTDLNARLAQHAAGRGARLMEVITAAGIGFTLARTWHGSRSLERQLKNRHNSVRLCPICRAAANTVPPAAKGSGQRQAAPSRLTR